VNDYLDVIRATDEAAAETKRFIEILDSLGSITGELRYFENKRKRERHAQDIKRRRQAKRAKKRRIMRK